MYMKAKSVPIYTKLISLLSTIFLSIILLGLIFSPFISKQMENTNYSLSDKKELIFFENLLDKYKIPFSQISDKVISVPKASSEMADELFEEYISK